MGVKWTFGRTFVVLLGVLAGSPTFAQQHLCSVFQPFRVTPENAKFQIGGPFPLHTDDCVHVRQDVVQELIAVQWALSHWNQNPQNANYRLGMSAADTCSREAEGLSQTMTFLNDAGYFSPKECKQSDASMRTPLGLIMPTIYDGKLNGLRDVLSGVQVPVVAYSSSAAQTLFDANIATAFSTAATLEHFAKVVSILLKSLKSNMVSVVYSSQHMKKPSLDRHLSHLYQQGIIVTETIPFAVDNHVDVKEKLSEVGSSQIVLIISSKDELIDFFMSSAIKAGKMQKLYITLPVHGEAWPRGDVDDFLLPALENARAIIVQQKSIFGDDQFRAYFLDILRNNYQSYSLLATYMQQIYNCTLIGTADMTDCDKVEMVELIDKYTSNRAVESAVFATYVFGALAKAMTLDPDEPCARSGPACTQKAVEFLKGHFAYTFDDFDPPAYRGFTMRFGQDRTLLSLPLEAVYVSRVPQVVVEAILNTTNGDLANARVQTDSVRWANKAPIRSLCQQWQSKCQQCTKTVVPEHVWLQKSGHLYLMGLFDMRQMDETTGQCNRTIDDARSVTMPAAFSYVLETVKRKYPELHVLPDLELGGLVSDTCHSTMRSVQTIMASSAPDQCMVVAENDLSNVSVPSKNVLAFASGQNHAHYDLTRRLFQKQGGVQKPLVGSTGERSTAGHTFYDVNLAPSYDVQSKAIVDLLVKYSWDYVSVILSDHDPESVRAYESFKRLAESGQVRICIGDVVYARAGQKIQSVRSANAPATKIAIAFTTVEDTVLYLKTHPSYENRRPTGSAGSENRDDDKLIYILTGDAHEFAESKAGGYWKKAAFGALSVQPRKAVDTDFRVFLSTVTPKRLPERWFISFWEDYFQCAVRPESVRVHKRACTGEERLPVASFGRMSREAYFIDALEALVFALDGMYKKMCPKTPKGELCQEFFESDFSKALAEWMSGVEKTDQFIVYNYRPAGKTEGAYFEIGNWTTTDGLRLSQPWSWYDSEKNINITLPESTCQPPLCRCHLDKDFFKKPLQALALSPADTFEPSENEETPSRDFLGKGIKTAIKNGLIGSENIDLATFTIRRDLWKNQSWTYIFIVINTLLLVAAILVLALVSVKLCFRVIKGNQSLGICLLFGVILLYITAYFFIFDPCETLCRLRYFAHSFSYSICFGVMIAKAVQLRNSETLGFNGFVSYWNYWLLLFFVVAVQIALNMQWAIVRDPVTVSFLEADTKTPTVVLKCSWSMDEFLASQVYVVVLLMMALFLALMNRNVKRNYKETRWLMYTSMICAPIFLVWMTSYALIPDPFKDTVIVMELITCATVILCFMFGPKIYILLSYEPVLIEYPPGFKFGSDPLRKQADKPLPSMYKVADTDVVANMSPMEANLSFDVDDDHNDDGRRSVISATSTKSTTLSHTLSSASNDSATPVYQAVIRKKSRSKKIKADGQSPASGSQSPEAQHRPHSTIFEETVSSVH